MPASAPHLVRAFVLCYPVREGRKGNITGEQREKERENGRMKGEGEREQGREDSVIRHLPRVHQ